MGDYKRIPTTLKVGSGTDMEENKRILKQYFEEMKKSDREFAVSLGLRPEDGPRAGYLRRSPESYSREEIADAILCETGRKERAPAPTAEQVGKAAEAMAKASKDSFRKLLKNLAVEHPLDKVAIRLIEEKQKQH